MYLLPTKSVYFVKCVIS